MYRMDCAQMINFPPQNSTKIIKKECVKSSLYQITKEKSKSEETMTNLCLVINLQKGLLLLMKTERKQPTYFKAEESFTSHCFTKTQSFHLLLKLLDIASVSHEYGL